WCTDQRPVPMIAFHGTADAAAPYKGGFSWVAPQRFQGVRAFTARWARRNRCGTNPVDSVVAPDVTRLEYTNCADDAAVVLYTIKGGGHTWPGGQPLPEWFVGRTSNSIDASSLMWAFFRAHRLREAQTGVHPDSLFPRLIGHWACAGPWPANRPSTRRDLRVVAGPRVRADARSISQAALNGMTYEAVVVFGDRKSTRLNSSHVAISYAVFCLKKKKKRNDC